MKQIVTLSLFALAIIFSGCGPTAQTEIVNNAPEDWKSLNEADYSIQYPDTFDLDKSGMMGAKLMLFSKQTSQEDLFRENVNLVIQDLAGQSISLDDFAKLSEEQIKKMLTDVNILESRKISINDKDFHKIIYTGKQGQYDLKFQQLYCIENGKIFILTFTAEAKQYDNYISVSFDIMKTLKMK